MEKCRHIKAQVLIELFNCINNFLFDFERVGTALLVIALEVGWGITGVAQISTANPPLVLKSEDKLKEPFFFSFN